jgi:hypothetical protein
VTTEGTRFLLLRAHSASNSTSTLGSSLSFIVERIAGLSANQVAQISVREIRFCPLQPCFRLEVLSFQIYRHVLVIELACSSRRSVGGSMTSPRGLQVDAGLDSSNEDASSVANNFFMYIFKVRAQFGRPCLSVPASMCLYSRQACLGSLEKAAYRCFKEVISAFGQ